MRTIRVHNRRGLIVFVLTNMVLFVVGFLFGMGVL